MLFSLSRTKGLLLAGALTLAGLVPHLAIAQAGAQGRPDATNVQMVSVPETYCRSIDNTDMTGQDYYSSAADVTAKSGKVIQSHNGGKCCTAASPWNGTSCAAPLVCASGTEAVNGSCVATAASCAAIGMTLINGACGVATPPVQPPFDLNKYWGRMIGVQTSSGQGEIKFGFDKIGGKIVLRLYTHNNGYCSDGCYYTFPMSINPSTGVTQTLASVTQDIYLWTWERSFILNAYGTDMRFKISDDGITAFGSKRSNLYPWKWTPTYHITHRYIDPQPKIPF